MLPERQKKSMCFVFIAAFIFCALPLYPQSKSISSIEVIGLRRTKTHIALYPLEKFLGREGASLDFNEVQAAVRDTGILEPLNVELSEEAGGLTLRVTVEEKWSIFPFPMISGGSGGTNFGLFLVDLNAFGLKDMAVLGGMRESSGWLAMAMYRHTPNRRGQPGWNSFFSYSKREQEDVNRDEEIQRRYTAVQSRFSLGLVYPFTGYVTGSADISFSNTSLEKTASDLNEPQSDVRHLGFSPGMAVRYSGWDGRLLSEKSLSLDYGYNFALAGASFHEAEFRAVYEQSLVPGFRLTLKSGAVWKSEGDKRADPLFEEGPQKAQVDILPRNFSARYYTGFSAGLEKSLAATRYGTLSVLGSWQCVFSDGPISGREFDHGPYAGMRFYLSRLALPALGGGIAYNVNSGLYQFTFSVGMSF